MTRSSYDACLTAAAGVTPDIQDCIAAEFEYQDARLNQAYQAALAKGDRAAQEALREAQRQWIEERDAQCALDPDGGQGQRLESNDCALELTAKRAAELEAM